MDAKIPHAPMTSFTEPPYIDDLVTSVYNAPLTILGLAFTSSAYKHGPEGERALIERLCPRTRDILMATTCLAAEETLKFLDKAGAEYFRSAGFDVVQHARCGLPSGQKFVTRPALYDWIEKTVAPSGVEALLVGGTASGLLELLMLLSVI